MKQEDIKRLFQVKKTRLVSIFYIKYVDALRVNYASPISTGTTLTGIFSTISDDKMWTALNCISLKTACSNE